MVPVGPQTNPVHGNILGQTSMDRIPFAVFIHENKSQCLFLQSRVAPV